MKSNNKSRLKQENFKLRRKQRWDKNLYRSRTNKKLSGVCGGIAEQLNVEPWIIRLLFVGSFFIIGGLSIILYIFATFVIAKRPKHQTWNTTKNAMNTLLKPCLNIALAPAHAFARPVNELIMR